MKCSYLIQLPNKIYLSQWIPHAVPEPATRAPVRLLELVWSLAVHQYGIALIRRE